MFLARALLDVRNLAEARLVVLRLRRHQRLDGRVNLALILRQRPQRAAVLLDQPILAVVVVDQQVGVDRRELLNWVAKNDADALTAMLDEYARKAVASGTRWLPGVAITEQRKVA